MSGLDQSRRGFLTVSTALGLSGLYGVYAHFVNPLVTARPLGTEAVGSTFPGLPPRVSTEAADRWLPAEPWASQAAYQLRTDEAYIYFNEWEQTDSDEAVRLKPFALIWMTGGEDEEPIRISCESAYLRFESKFKMPNASPGRVIGGALEGNVRIQGKDGLDVGGKNFVFSESANRVFSENHVRFRHGPHRGEALGLQMELIPDDDAKEDAAVAVSGIKSVTLRKQVSMDLKLGDEIPASKPSPGDAPTDEQQPTPVRIRCDGSFTFVTESNEATFEENVRVLREVSPSEADSLLCDKLTLSFEAADAAADEAKGKPGDPAEDESRRFEGISGRLAFQRLLAEGREVRLISKANGMQANMNRLQYDAADRIAVLNDKKFVRVQQGASELIAPEITLMHEEAGSVTSAWCRGAGRLIYVDTDTGELQLEATWARQLRMHPDPEAESTLNVIELDQQAIVQQPLQQSGLAAEFIKLWIKPQPSGADRADAAAVPQNAEQVQIDRMLAEKNVVMISPDMQADTERLEVWFEEADLPDPPTDSTPLRPAVGSRRPAASGEVARGNRRPPQTPSAKSAPVVDAMGNRGGGKLKQTSFRPDDPPAEQPAAAEAKPRQPVIVVSDLIRAKILVDSQRRKHQVAEVDARGHVAVTQQRDEGSQPLRISGDKLKMESRSEDEQVVKVLGEPAHIVDPQMHIQGNKITFDSSRNRVSVDGAGLLQIPVTKDMDGKPLETPQDLDIAWQEKMVFDGETARFLGDVRTSIEWQEKVAAEGETARPAGGVRTGIQQSQLSCREMDVLLTERISFADADRPDIAAADDERRVNVKLIVCKGGVALVSRKHLEQELEEIRRGHVRDLTLDYTTGAQLAHGPGWLAIWRKGEPSRAGLSSIATVQANRPLKPETAAWEYTRIDFAGRSEGNMKERFSTFFDRVEIVHGPIASPLDTIDPDDPDDLPVNGGRMNCEDKLVLTQVEKTEMRPAYLKALGSGNVKLEGRMPNRNRPESRGESFQARADTVSFDQSKGQYILRSQGSRMATIWRQKQSGGEYSRHDARRLEFIPELNRLKSLDTIGTIGTE